MAQNTESLTKEELKGKALKTKGKVKVELGKKCKSKKLQLEGDLEQAAGFVEEEIGKVKKVVKKELGIIKEDIKKKENEENKKEESKKN